MLFPTCDQLDKVSTLSQGKAFEMNDFSTHPIELNGLTNEQHAAIYHAAKARAARLRSETMHLIISAAIDAMSAHVVRSAHWFSRATLVKSVNPRHLSAEKQ
jgi:hypothetical protein